jgi:plasmid stabilization system protein ParE
MSHRVVFTPEALDQLAALYQYISVAASPAVALRYTDAIVNYCESLTLFPHRGTMRDDVRKGLRITHYKKRTVIAFAVDAAEVVILGIFYGGQNHESRLSDDSEDDKAH